MHSISTSLHEVDSIAAEAHVSVTAMLSSCTQLKTFCSACHGVFINSIVIKKNLLSVHNTSHYVSLVFDRMSCNRLCHKLTDVIWAGPLHQNNNNTKEEYSVEEIKQQ